MPINKYTLGNRPKWFRTKTLNIDNIPLGICQCGCGGKTAIAKNSDKSKGWIKGQPKFLIYPHHRPKITHDMCYSVEYHAWQNMKARCARDPKYTRKGITVCSQWINDFKQFLNDVGPRPPMPQGRPLHYWSLDRFPNNNGNYEPGNVRWATYTQQANNQEQYHNKGRKGEDNASAKLTESNIRKIRQLNARGMGSRKIAKLFPVSRDCIRHILIGKTWTHVT